MKKSVYTIILIVCLGFGSNAQESVPFSLKQFVEKYGSAFDEYLSGEEIDKNFSFGDYFINAADTLFWPDNFKLEDKYIKHRLGPMEYYKKFGRFKNLSTVNFNYTMREFDEIKLVRSKPGKYYDKFRILVKENHIFSSSDFFGSDSIVSISKFYDVVSWFNPDLSNYEYRINKISDQQSSNQFAPDAVRFNLELLFPSLSGSQVSTNSSGYGASMSAFWLLGGKNTVNYSFKTGLGISSYRFKMNDYNSLFENEDLIDKDNYPFTLISNLKGVNQSLSFQSLTLPVQFQLTKFDKKGKFSTGLFGGINLNFPVNSSTENTSGEITYSGKYKFDFDPEPVVLEDVESYHFKTFQYSDMKSSAPKLNSMFLAAEVGGEFNWHLGKKWVANLNISYQKALTPLYSNSGQTIAYDLVDKNAGKTFDPAMNSFLALNADDHLNSFKLGIGISYLLEKPVIPHGRVGYRNKEIQRIAKDKLVLTAGSFGKDTHKKIVNIAVNSQSSGMFSSKINYQYIGPTSKYYKQGKLNQGAKKGNELELLVPALNFGTKLFIEEPYGYNLKPEGIAFAEGGMYGEMKIMKCEDIWKGSDTQMNLKLVAEKLAPLNIYLINYKFSLDDGGIHREKIMTRIKEEVSRVLQLNENAVVYVLSDKPRAFMVNKSMTLSVMFDDIKFELQSTDNVSSNIEGLSSFLSKETINPRRELKVNLFTAEEFVDLGKSSLTDFCKTLNVDNSFVEFALTLHSYGSIKPPKFDEIMNDLKKIGKINE